jgi:chemotaxis protein histidine kinase CheA
MSIPPHLREAFALFCTELETHLQFFSEVLHQPAQDDYQGCARALESRFHLIKGGAGFFGLTALRELAGEKERVFRAPHTAESFREALAVHLAPAANMVWDELQRLAVTAST